MPYTIRELRKQTGLSQEKLAEALGVSTGTIHRWEFRLVKPTQRHRLRLAEMFQISIDDLADAPLVDNATDDQHDER